MIIRDSRTPLGRYEPDCKDRDPLEGLQTVLGILPDGMRSWRDDKGMNFLFKSPPKLPARSARVGNGIPLADFICAQCAKPFTAPRMRTTLRCSDACRSAAYRDRQKLKGQA